jgi:DNA repair exonuclease SbcCD ATPase subunit
MQTIEEYKAYTKQLEGEVSKWHHAYDNLMIERNLLATQMLDLKSKLHRANSIIAAIPKQDSATEIDTLTSGIKNLKDSLEACSSELEELRKHEVEWDLSKARILELEKELQQYKEGNHGN